LRTNISKYIYFFFNIELEAQFYSVFYCVHFQVKAHIQKKERQLGEQNWRLSPLKQISNWLNKLCIYATINFTDVVA